MAPEAARRKSLALRSQSSLTQHNPLNPSINPNNPNSRVSPIRRTTLTTLNIGDSGGSTVNNVNSGQGVINYINNNNNNNNSDGSPDKGVVGVVSSHRHMSVNISGTLAKGTLRPDKPYPMPSNNSNNYNPASSSTSISISGIGPESGAEVRVTEEGALYESSVHGAVDWHRRLSMFDPDQRKPKPWTEGANAMSMVQLDSNLLGDLEGEEGQIKAQEPVRIDPNEWRVLSHKVVYQQCVGCVQTTFNVDGKELKPYVLPVD